VDGAADGEAVGCAVEGDGVGAGVGAGEPPVEPVGFGVRTTATVAVAVVVDAGAVEARACVGADAVAPERAISPGRQPAATAATTARANGTARRRRGWSAGRDRVMDVLRAR
jgi:hypothetical protein